MKTYTFVLTALFFLSVELYSQAIKGKVIDENEFGLAGIDLKLYVSSNVYSSATTANGSFVFQNVTEVRDELLPTGYAISNNFPNPFNPKTRISIKIPTCSIVKVETFNILGQSVNKPEEKYLDTDLNFIDVELNGLPSGIYIARITIDNKFVALRKMMLIYGSQHLASDEIVPSQNLNKTDYEKITILETQLDSLVATSAIIGRKVFTNLPNLVGDTTDLGNLLIERFCPGLPTIIYEGKTYHTVQIGNQCWLKENLDVGKMIPGILNQTNNDTIEKYCYNNSIVSCEHYGGLYQGNEAMRWLGTQGQGICPDGWHIPTLAQFQTLRYTVNTDANALKREDQGSGNGQGTNTSGFSAELVGCFDFWSNLFRDLGSVTIFWSSTSYYGNSAFTMLLSSTSRNIGFGDYNKEHWGLSIRCLKD